MNFCKAQTMYGDQCGNPVVKDTELCWHHTPGYVRPIEKLKGLLKMAKCPDCDGSGTVQQSTDKTWERGDGEIFAVTEPAQCQWCDEVKKILESKR